MTYPYKLIDEFIQDIVKTEYTNPELIEFLTAEKLRLRELDRQASAMRYQMDDERQERIRQEQNAAKRKILESKLAKITDKKDKEKALELISKLERLNSGTPIYDEFEIELNRLFRFYDSIQ